MLPAQYYHPIFLFLVTILSIYSFFQLSQFKGKNDDIIEVENQIPSIVLTIFMILFIGLRPISGRYFLDMYGTAYMWEWYNQGQTYSFKFDYVNKIYDNLRSFMSTYGMSVEYFFFLIALIYFLCIYIACKKQFPKNTLFALLVYYIAFSTYSYATNGIKAGSAAAIFLVALSYYENKKILIIMTLLSWGFHHSMIVVVCSMLCVYYVRKPQYYFYFWVFSFLIATFHISFFQRLFASIGQGEGAGYLLGQSHGKGYRLDFIAYSAVPVIIGYYCIFQKKVQSERYNILLNLYLMTNSIWMLCMYAEFTNRIAYLSWFLHPWVMIYPLLNEKITDFQFKYVNILAIGHLAFNLYLSLIYWS